MIFVRVKIKVTRDFFVIPLTRRSYPLPGGVDWLIGDFLNSIKPPPFLGHHLWNLLYDLVTRGSPQTLHLWIPLAPSNVPCEIRACPPPPEGRGRPAALIASVEPQPVCGESP